MTDYNAIIDKYYPAGTLRRDIYIKHCRQVADLAVDISRRNRLALDENDIVAASMLHDIGIFMTHAPSIGCEGAEKYIAHGYLGARLLRGLGADEKIVRVAETHTGAGITASDIEMLGLPIPPADYMPRTTLERLVCYADKFYSKSGDMKEKPLERVIASMSKGFQEGACFDSSPRRRRPRPFRRYGEGVRACRRAVNRLYTPL